MFCQKCQSKMQYTYVGHSQSTVEMWACTGPGCDYTFELRSNARGFHFCFMQDENLAFDQNSSAHEAERFPEEVFMVGKCGVLLAGEST